jgi:PncC family amidohydrolase
LNVDRKLESIHAGLRARGWRIATAESCTAGLVADRLASLPGASATFWGAYVCYTPAAKVSMLGIDPRLIQVYGAVSREVAAAMAEHAVRMSGVELAVAVSGLAGPEGDGTPTPVGTIWIATALAGGDTRTALFVLNGDRDTIRDVAAELALAQALARLT